MRINNLQGQLDAMTSILKQLKSDKEQAAEQQSVLALRQLMNANIDKIKVKWKELFFLFETKYYIKFYIKI